MIERSIYQKLPKLSTERKNFYCCFYWSFKRLVQNCKVCHWVNEVNWSRSLWSTWGWRLAIFICIDYFSKWSEAIKNNVVSFLYAIICRDRRIKIQMNDRGKEFVNQVAESLHQVAGTEQRITSIYYPQFNGLGEHENCIIKDSLIKALVEYSL